MYFNNGHILFSLTIPSIFLLTRKSRYVIFVKMIICHTYLYKNVFYKSFKIGPFTFTVLLSIKMSINAIT